MKETYLKFEPKANSDEIEISFLSEKFATKHLDEFECFFRKVINKRKKPIFNLSTLTWIGHEELVYLSALFHQLYSNEIEFAINLKITHNRYVGKLELRNKRTVVFLWENLKDFFDKEVEIDEEGIDKIFDITKEDIDELKEQLGSGSDFYYVKIVPVKKISINKGGIPLSEALLNKYLKDLFKLDKIEEETQKLLDKHNSTSPFLNETLSSVIAKELYENAIEHAYVGDKKRKTRFPTCYMSVSLLRKMKEDNENKESTKEKQFEDEAIPESEDFYKQDGVWTNQSYIQFTFMDFGDGIPYSLKTSEKVKEVLVGKTDSEIIKDACNLFLSRHPIDEKYNVERFPRGLFDVISIVQRYKGLITIRSGKGKALYNFSRDKELKECAVSFYEGEEWNFSGTIITILLPESSGIKTNTLRPVSQEKLQLLEEITQKELLYINILDIQRQAREKILQSGEDMKEHIYNRTLENLDRELEEQLKERDNCCMVIDFNCCWDKDNGVVKKITRFLVLNNRFSIEKNAVIINPPSIAIMVSIQEQLISNDMRNLTQQPTPCIFRNKGEIEILWLGVDKNESFEEMTRLLTYENYTVAMSDFIDPDKIKETGLVRFDEYGGVHRLFSIEKIEKRIGEIEIEKGLKARIEKNIIDEIKIDDNKEDKKEKVAFLCSGNYYHSKYLNIIESLYDPEDLEVYANVAYKIIRSNIDLIDLINDKTKILSVTLSSQLLARKIIDLYDEYLDLYDESLKEKLSANFIRLSNYHSYFLEDEFTKIGKEDNVFIICDVISTGNTVKSLREKLKKRGATLCGILALCDIREDKEYLGVRLISLCDNLDMPKLASYNAIPSEIRNDEKKIIRVNPATNALITMSQDKTERETTILLDNFDDFFDIANLGDHLKRGYFKDNQRFYPWYFDTRQILRNKEGRKLLKKAIEIITNLQTTHRKEIETDIEKISYIFYPAFSGAEEIDSEIYRHDVFGGKDIKFVSIGRFTTPYGYRYTFPPKFLNEPTLDKNVLIFDDGSCSGTTIIQMLDEISFLNVQSIIVLSIIGRNDDFMREFFSRIRRLKTKDIVIYENRKGADGETRTFKTKKGRSIPISIYFVSQWQIQTFNINPFVEENKLLTHYQNMYHLPSLLADYIDKRKKRLKFHPVNYEDSKSDSLIPKDIPPKEMLKVRNHIGEIAEYRFYRENFYYFNKFVNNYHNNLGSTGSITDKNVVREIELMLSVLLHEPYLIHSIRDFLPDVFDILKKFTSNIIYEKIKYNGEPKVLNYEWNCASLLSIYLNFRREEGMASEDNILKESEISHIIDFIEHRKKEETEDPLPLFFMFILEFIPKEKDERSLLRSKGISLLTEISKYIDTLINKSNHIDSLPHINTFKDLLNYIPYLNKDIDNEFDCIKLLNIFFIEERNILHHGNSIYYILTCIRANCEVILTDIQFEARVDAANKINNSWGKVSFRLSKFCQYTNRIRKFIELYDDKSLANVLFELEPNIYKEFLQISDIIRNSSISYDYHLNYLRIKNYAAMIESVFKEKSTMEQIFTQLYTSGIFDIYMEKFKDHQVLVNEIDNNLEIDFPQLYFKEVFLKELASNFEDHTDDQKPIKAKFLIENEFMKLIISNYKSSTSKKGSNHGEKLFKDIKEVFGEKFSYKFTNTENDRFIQEYSFKIIKNHGQ